jgi:hypothetical protein
MDLDSGKQKVILDFATCKHFWFMVCVTSVCMVCVAECLCIMDFGGYVNRIVRRLF